MAKILYVKTGNTKGRITLGIENGGECRGYSVTENTYFALGSPPRGYELSETVFSRVSVEDEEYRAMKKAVSLLAVSDKSTFTMRQKLMRAGFDRDIVREVVEECVRRGYIDEGRQLDRLVTREANDSLRGRMYIKRKLVSKGYRADEIDAAIDRMIETGEIDFARSFERLAAKKCATDSESRRILKYKYGYVGEDY